MTDDALQLASSSPRIPGTRSSASLPAPVIVAAALAGAVIAGAAMALNLRLGLAAAVGLCYVPLALLNVRLAIVLWVPSIFLIAVTALDVGPNLAGIVIVLSWVGAVAAHRSRVPELILANARVLVPMAGLVVWVMVSMAWAESSSVGNRVFWGWIAAGLIVLVVSTIITDRHYLRLVCWAFVLGSVISVMLGLLGAVQEPSVASPEATGRIVGGAGDPNFLAAGVVPALVLAAGLAAGSRLIAARVAAAAAIALLTVGLAASASRGGFVAAIVAAIAVLVLAKRHRLAAIAFLLFLVGIGATWFTADPAAWERVSDFNESNGRSELWGVASQMWQDNAVIGVGFQSFVDNAGSYVRELGSLEYAEFLTERPLVVHSTYLELLAETGIVGLGLFIAVLVGTLRAAWHAVGAFERLGDRPMATLARSVIAATVAMLASAAFVSGGIDRRFWLLVAIGPALLATARLEETFDQSEDRPTTAPRRMRGRHARGSLRTPAPLPLRS